MASLSLAAVGFMIPGAGAWAPALGAVIGGVADQWLIPALFPTEDAPRFSGQPISYAEEGAPLVRVWGGVDPSLGVGLRIGGAVTWASENYSEIASGGGKRGEPITRTWFTDIEVTLASHPTASIDELFFDGEPAFTSTTQNTISTATANTLDTAPVTLDYTTIQEFRYFPVAAQTVLKWVLIVRTSRNGSGTPLYVLGGSVDPALDRIREGDEVAVALLDPAGTQLSRVRGSGPITWNCVYSARDANGNSEAHLELTNGITNEAFMLNDVTGFYGTPPSGGIPSIDYPIWPVTVGNQPLTLVATRPAWRPGVLRASTPINGVDYEFALGERNGEQTEIAKLAQFGGLGSNAPYDAQVTKVALKGVNLSRYGNRVPSITAVVREGANVGGWRAFQELCHLAGVPFRRCVPVNRARFIAGAYHRQFNIASVGSGNAKPAAAGRYEVRGTLTVPLDVNAGEVFVVAVTPAEPVIDDDTIFYRIQRIANVSTNTYDIQFTPKLAEDFSAATATFYVYGIGGPLCRGFRVDGQGTTSAAIAPLLIAYGLEFREHGGRIWFYDTAERQKVTVDPLELATVAIGSPPEDPINVGEAADESDVRRIDVRYARVDKRAQTGSEGDQDPDGADDWKAGDEDTASSSPTNRQAAEVMSLQQVAMLSSEARGVARRLLRDAKDFRQTASIKLPTHRSLHIETGDEINFSTYPDEYLTVEGIPLPYGRPWTLIVDECDTGDNGVRAFRNFVAQDESAIPPAGIPNPPNGGINPDPNTQFPGGYLGTPAPSVEIVDVGAMRDGESQTPGVYAAAIPAGQLARPVVGAIYRDADGSGRLVSSGSIAVGTRGGSVVAGYSLWTGAIVGVWDYVSSIRVAMQSGALETVTEDEAASGANFAIIGNELVRFRTATLVSAGVYTLTGFLRGLRGTGHEIGNHVAGAGTRFVWLGHEFDVQGVTFVPLSLASSGVESTYAVVVPGQSVDTARQVQHAAELRSARPLPVANLSWRRDGVGVTVRWDRMPRSRWLPLTGAVAPNVEGAEVYRVELFEFPSGILRHSELVTDATTFSITIAEEAEIVLDGQDYYDVRVTRVSTQTLDGISRTVQVHGDAQGYGHGSLDY